MAAARILLIDDDELLQDLLAMHLEVEGYAVRTASNGEAGLRRIKEGDTDLIVLDLMMPVMDGLRFIRLLKEDVPSPPPVVVLSAAGDGELEREMLGAGARAVVRKPVEPAELLAALRAALGRDPSDHA